MQKSAVSILCQQLMRYLQRLTAFLALLPFSAGLAPAATAEKVFQAVSPSVVLIEDGEGSGAGVVLKPDGLILTNFHVINSPLKFKVQATVKEGDKVITKIFDEVQVLKVSNDYDLALVKVNVKGDSLIPATIRNPAEKLKTGAVCYAIGNPGVETFKLNNTMTQGIVSAAAREIESKEYVQFDAAINPGNSGGALCDEFGRVFGIVTFMAGNAQGLGFAIPTERIDMTQFVDPKDKTGDVKRAQALFTEGHDYLSGSVFGHPEERAIMISSAHHCFKAALAETPNDAKICVALASIYKALGKKELRLAYLEAAARLDSANAVTKAQLGVLYFEAGNEAAALPLLQETLQKPPKSLSSMDMGASALYCAMLLNKKEDSFRCLYLANWSEELTMGSTQQKEMRKLLISKYWDRLTEKQRLELAKKRETYSWEEMEKFAKGESIEAGGFASPPADSSQSRPVVAGAASRQTSARGTQDPWKESTPISKKHAAQPGQLFEWPMDIPNPASVILEEGPPGLNWDSAKKCILWDVPATVENGSYRALLSYRREDQRYGYELVEITVQSK